MVLKTKEGRKYKVHLLRAFHFMLSSLLHVCSISSTLYT